MMMRFMESNSPSFEINAAVSLMIIFGIIGILSIFLFPGIVFYGTTWTATVFYSMDYFVGAKLSFHPDFVFFFESVVFLGAFFIIPFFLSKKKKWAWWFTVFSLLMSIILIFLYLFFLLDLPLIFSLKVALGNGFSGARLTYFLYPLALLILLFFGRKNFWKIAT